MAQTIKAMEKVPNLEAHLNDWRNHYIYQNEILKVNPAALLDADAKTVAEIFPKKPTDKHSFYTQGRPGLISFSDLKDNQKMRIVAAKDCVELSRIQKPDAYTDLRSQEVIDTYVAAFKRKAYLEQKINETNKVIAKNEAAEDLLKKIGQNGPEYVAKMLNRSQEDRQNAVDGAKEGLGIENEKEADKGFVKRIKKFGNDIKFYATLVELANSHSIKYDVEKNTYDGRTEKEAASIVKIALQGMYNAPEDQLGQKALDNIEKIRKSNERLTHKKTELAWCVAELVEFLTTEQGINGEAIYNALNKADVSEAVKTKNPYALMINNFFMEQDIKQSHAREKSDLESDHQLKVEKYIKESGAREQGLENEIENLNDQLMEKSREYERQISELQTQLREKENDYKSNLTDITAKKDYQLSLANGDLEQAKKDIDLKEKENKTLQEKLALANRMLDNRLKMNDYKNQHRDVDEFKA